MPRPSYQGFSGPGHPALSGSIAAAPASGWLKIKPKTRPNNLADRAQQLRNVVQAVTRAQVVGTMPPYATSNARKENLIRQAKSHPCVDCEAVGLPDIWPIESKQLDHLDQYKKRFYLSKLGQKERLVGWDDYYDHTVAEVIEEISHCEVVCGNHHLQRTNKRRRKSYQQERVGQGVLTETVPAPRGRHPWYELLLRHNPGIWES